MKVEGKKAGRAYYQRALNPRKGRRDKEKKETRHRARYELFWLNILHKICFGSFAQIVVRRE